MSVCHGKFTLSGATSLCYKQVYKCKNCGAVGCDREGCHNQEFDWTDGRCMRCNSQSREKV